MSAFWNETLARNCRRLFLRNFEISTQIGVYEFEKLAPQRLIFNVDMYVLLSQSTPTRDHFTEVVDYDFIRRTIVQRVSNGHVELQETLCDSVADLLMQHSAVQAVRVSTQKPDIYPDCEGVGVEILRFKA